MSEYSPEELDAYWNKLAADAERDWWPQVEWFTMDENATVEEQMTEAQFIRQWEREQE